MTILQPDRANAFWNRILVGLVVTLIFSAGWMVWLYTHLVNLNHNLTQMRTEAHNLQTANSELKDNIFALFRSDELQKFAAAHQLVQDRAPQYLTVNQSWYPDSHY